MPTITSALRKLPKPAHTLPDLPVGHLTFARSFHTIASSHRLATKHCPVFRTHILYLFYGALSYRTTDGSTRDKEKAPVAFLFGPSVLQKRGRFYPFDTGAAAAGMYGTALGPFTSTYRKDLRFRGEPNVAARFAYHAFGSIENYINGTPDGSCATYPEPFPSLFRFYSTDLTPVVDQRQSRIEVQLLEHIELPEDLLFVGFPMSKLPDFRRICKASTVAHVPENWPYPDSDILKPNELAAKLEARCEPIINRYAKLLG